MLAFANYYNPVGYMTYSLNRSAEKYQYPYQIDSISAYGSGNTLYLINNLRLQQQNYNQAISYENNHIRNYKPIQLNQLYNQNSRFRQTTPIISNNYTNNNLRTRTNTGFRHAVFQRRVNPIPNIHLVDINQNDQANTSVDYFLQNNFNINNNQIMSNNNIMLNQVSTFDNRMRLTQGSPEKKDNNMRLTQITPVNNNMGLNKLNSILDDPMRLSLTNQNNNNLEINQLFSLDNNNNNMRLSKIKKLNNNMRLNQLFPLDNRNNIGITNSINNNILLNQIQNRNDVMLQPSMYEIENNINLINTDDLNDFHDLNKMQRKSSLKISRNKSPPKMNINGQFVDSNNNPFIFDEKGQQRKSNMIRNIEQNNIINNQNLKKSFKSEKSSLSINYFRAHCEGSQVGRNLDGEIKTNQDSYLVKIKIADIPGFNLFGVFDGHGTDGHFASNFAKDYILQEITKFAQNMKLNGVENVESIYQILKNENFNTITQIYKNTDQEMMKQQWDYELSGTTCNIVFQFGQHLICASVGDSRAILIYDNNPNLITSNIFNLSYDHKPELPEELQRIKMNGGCLRRIKDEDGIELGGPLRVWHGDEDYPGLAMSRSLGDIEGKKCGVIPIPQYVEYTLNDTSKYMVICTDGVWEFISEEQVKQLGNPFYLKEDIAGHCQNLIINSINMWETNDIMRDDITAVIVYF